MIIGSISENKELEKRISITPEITKKYIDLGFEVQLNKNYGKHLGFEDKEYSELGVKFFSDDKKLIDKYKNYESLGQSGWALDRLVDESTLEVEEVPEYIYPEWFKFNDLTNPKEKEKLIDLYKDEI